MKKDYPKAEIVFKEAVKLAEEIVGKNHSDCIAYKKNLEKTQKAMKK